MEKLIGDFLPPHIGNSNVIKYFVTSCHLFQVSRKTNPRSADANNMRGKSCQTILSRLNL